MSEPQITYVIPTLDRANLLPRAIDSCLRQTVPVKVLVADQGETDATRKVLEAYKHREEISSVATKADSLLENWKAGTKAATTPYVAWVQDDDKIGKMHGMRIVDAFEQWPEAHCWIARLSISDDGVNSLWWIANGPLLAMNVLDKLPMPVVGELFAPVAYCTSMALSPAVAFRTGDKFNEVLDSLPPGCDLYTERLILAGMGEKGPIVCDPYECGLWIHHGLNESYRQREKQEEQCAKALPWLDDIMDRLDEWKYPFRKWVDRLPVGHMAAFGGAIFAPEMEQSRHCK